MRSHYGSIEKIHYTVPLNISDFVWRFFSADLFEYKNIKRFGAMSV
jgi:hypothetical protein